MDEVHSKNFRREIVRLDGKLFLDCVFEDCLLQYGGDRCEWVRTSFSNCRMELDGCAKNTVQILQGLGCTVMTPDSEGLFGSVQ